MKHYLLLPLIATCLAFTSCQDPGSGNSTRAEVSDASRVSAAAPLAADEAEEQKIPLSEVPQAVKDAAIAALPGLVLEEADVEVEDGVTVYDLEGEVDGKEVEVEVTAAGEVLEVEWDEDDEDDDDEDDDDEDDDDEDDDDEDEDEDED